MALKENTQAPDFSLESTNGKIFTLSQHAAGKPLILYFYPRDFTPACTKEACEFRDTFNFFQDAQIDVYGISRDSLETHYKFQEAHRLPFDLLADEDGRVAELYKASVPLIKFTKRITYLLDKNHRIVGVYQNLFGARKHIHEMIEKVKAGYVA